MSLKGLNTMKKSERENRIPDAQAERNMRRALAWREREERRQMNAKRNA